MFREISEEELYDYQSHVFDRGSWVTEYLYLFPRTIQAGVIENEWWFSPEATGKRIRETDLPSWPKKRVDALNHFLTTLFDFSISKPDTGDAIDSWICAIAHMGLNIQPYLSQIEASDYHILSYYVENAHDLSQKKLSNSSWESLQIEHNQIVEWFYSDKVSSLIEKAYGIRLKS